MEKSRRKFTQKLVPGPFLILVSNPEEPMHAKNYFKESIIKKPSKSS